MPNTSAQDYQGVCASVKRLCRAMLRVIRSLRNSMGEWRGELWGESRGDILGESQGEPDLDCIFCFWGLEPGSAQLSWWFLFILTSSGYFLNSFYMFRNIQSPQITCWIINIILVNSECWDQCWWTWTWVQHRSLPWQLALFTQHWAMPKYGQAWIMALLVHIRGDLTVCCSPFIQEYTNPPTVSKY